MARLRRMPYTKPLPPDAKIVTYKGKPHARFLGDDGRMALAPLTRKGDRIRLLSAKWYGEYRDADAILRCVPLSTDKTAAGQMLADLVRKAEMGRAGLSDPFEAHRKRPLTAHLDDFESWLLAKGNGAKHARNAAARVRRIVEGCRFVFIGDIAVSCVQEFLAGLRDTDRASPILDNAREWYTKAELAVALGVKPHSIAPLVARWGLAAKGNGKARRYPKATAEALLERLNRSPGAATLNHYVRSVRTFTRWLVRDRRTGDDPLAGLSGVNASTDVRHARRPLSPEELGRLLQAALDSPATFRGLSGRDRHFLYLTACGTGLRASELASLTPSRRPRPSRRPTRRTSALPSSPSPPRWPRRSRPISPTALPANRSGPAGGPTTPRRCCRRTWRPSASPTPWRGQTARCTPTSTRCGTPSSASSTGRG
jgi:hypothetical protein